jgi:hypothetical protein
MVRQRSVFFNETSMGGVMNINRLVYAAALASALCGAASAQEKPQLAFVVNAASGNSPKPA